MAKSKNSARQRQNEREQKRDERRVRRALNRERQLDDHYLDKGDVDFVSFKNQLEVLGLKIKDIPGDGNCLFRALADQLEGDMAEHSKHRQETVRFMVDHRDDFEPFVEDDVPFDRHIDNLSKEGTFGGNSCIVAFSRNHKVDVVIHQHNAPALHIRGGDGDAARVLHLSYHNGEHYSSVRRIDEPAAAGAPGHQAAGRIAESGKENLKSRKLPSHQRKAKLPAMSHGGKGAPAAATSRSPQSLVAELVAPLIAMTGCEDYETLREALVACNFNVEEAAHFVLQLNEAKDMSMVTSLLDDASLGGELKDTQGTTTAPSSDAVPPVDTAASALSTHSVLAEAEGSVCNGSDGASTACAAAGLESQPGDTVSARSGAATVNRSLTCESHPDAACTCKTKAPAVTVVSAAASAESTPPSQKSDADEAALLAMQIQEILKADGGKVSQEEMWRQAPGKALDLSVLNCSGSGGHGGSKSQERQSGTVQVNNHGKAGKQPSTRVRKADKKKERKERRAEERKKEASSSANDGAANGQPAHAALAPRPDGVPKLVSI